MVPAHQSRKTPRGVVPPVNISCSSFSPLEPPPVCPSAARSQALTIHDAPWVALVLAMVMQRRQEARKLSLPTVSTTAVPRSTTAAPLNALSSPRTGRRILFRGPGDAGGYPLPLGAGRRYAMRPLPPRPGPHGQTKRPKARRKAAGIRASRRVLRRWGVRGRPRGVRWGVRGSRAGAGGAVRQPGGVRRRGRAAGGL